MWKLFCINKCDSPFFLQSQHFKIEDEKRIVANHNANKEAPVRRSESPAKIMVSCAHKHYIVLNNLISYSITLVVVDWFLYYLLHGMKWVFCFV